MGGHKGGMRGVWVLERESRVALSDARKGQERKPAHLTKEGREGLDDHDSDRDQPAGWQTFDFRVGYEKEGERSRGG